jgi:hypothetical protein
LDNLPFEQHALRYHSPQRGQITQISIAHLLLTHCILFSGSSLFKNKSIMSSLYLYAVYRIHNPPQSLAVSWVVEPGSHPPVGKALLLGWAAEIYFRSTRSRLLCKAHPNAPFAPAADYAHALGCAAAIAPPTPHARVAPAPAPKCWAGVRRHGVSKRRRGPVVLIPARHCSLREWRVVSFRFVVSSASLPLYFVFYNLG